jgi:beta-aspartyl-peptidase (threonine type)
MDRAIVPVVVVHGGAGDVPPERRAEHADGTRRAAEIGLDALLAGASALEAAVRAVEALEDDPRFNAGTGACLTERGTLELDAAVMEGAELRFGAVAALPAFRHPIRIADAVMREGRHALYAASGAAERARELGFAPADPEDMITEAARARLEEVLAGRAHAGWAGGTVGAVACAHDGTVAAATSTGGTVGKRSGRIGDTPLPGAGTWADDLAAACSATGIGEQIMRYGLARHACELVRSGVPAQEAASAAIAGFGARVRGQGGLILVSPRGDAGFARNTATMSYAIARAGQATVFGA